MGRDAGRDVGRDGCELSRELLTRSRFSIWSTSVSRPSPSLFPDRTLRALPGRDLALPGRDPRLVDRDRRPLLGRDLLRDPGRDAGPPRLPGRDPPSTINHFASRSATTEHDGTRHPRDPPTTPRKATLAEIYAQRALIEARSTPFQSSSKGNNCISSYRKHHIPKFDASRRLAGGPVNSTLEAPAAGITTT